jgi:Flp pilus assembly protein TadG
MPSPRRNRKRQSGQAIVLIALMLVVLIGFVGLALDGGRAYVDRRELQAAADAAALATADRFQAGATMPASQAAGAAIFAANERVYGASSATWCANPPASPPTSAPFPTCSATVTWSQDANAHRLTLGWTDYRGAGKGLVFFATASHALPLALMQVLGFGSTVSIGSTAQTVIFDQSQTPAILTLGRAPCNGQSGASLTVQGGNGLDVTVVGSVYSDGGITVGNGGIVNVQGNVYENCGVTPVDGISNPAYNEYSPVGPLSVNYVGGATLPVASNYGSAQAWPSASGNVDVFPGVYSSNPNLTGGNPCYFVHPGIYTFAAGYTDNKGLTSNELRPPDESVYNNNSVHAGALSAGNPSGPADGSYLQFWRNNGQTCDGTFAAGSVQSTGGGAHPLTPGGSWGVVVTSARQDVYYPDNVTAVNYARESSPSMCRLVPVNGSNSGFQVAVSNPPGAQWYNVYASPAGCSGPFGYAGSICNGTGGPGCTQTVTMSNSRLSCPNLPTWSGSTPIAAGAYQNNSSFSGSNGSCTLGFAVSPVYDSVALSGFSVTGTACAVVATPSTPPGTNCGPPDPELCPTTIFGCSTAVPNSVAAQNAPATGDRANENQCANASGSTTACPGQVTPGAVQYYFTTDSASCLSEGGGGGTWVFGGQQYNWIAVYSANATCSGNNANKIVGGSATSYVGALYFPFTSITLSGGGQTAISNQVIALNVTIDGSSGVTVDYNPKYVPAPPSGRLIV